MMRLDIQIAFGTTLVIVVTLLGWVLVELHRSRTDMSAMRDEMQTLSARNQAYTATQVSHIRSAVLSDKQEDVTFLKILYLKRRTKFEDARALAKLVCRLAKSHDKDINLVLSVMSHESHFDPAAKSGVGAMGLMQIMPNWVKIMQIEDPYDPEANLATGLKVLSMYEDMYRSLPTALAVYNKGPSVVDWDLIKDRNPLNKYADKVMRTYEKLKSMEAD